jgi:hypothetical protein
VELGGSNMWFPYFHGRDRRRRRHNRCNFWDNLMFIHCSHYDDEFDHDDCRDSRRNEAVEQKCFKINDSHSCKCHRRDDHHHEWNKCGCKKEHNKCGCMKEHHHGGCGCMKHHHCNCHKHREHHSKKCNCG